MKKRTTLITVLIFGLIGAVVFSFISNFFYFKYIKKINDQEIISNSEDTTNIAFDNIDRSFLSIANISSICLSNSDNYKKVIMNYDVKAITDSLKELNILLLSTPTIAAIDLYFPQEHIAITNAYNIHFDISDENVYSYLPWLQVYQNQEQPSLFLERGYNAYPIDNKSITYITKTPILTKNPDAILAIHITPAFFSEFLKEDKDQHFLLFDDNYRNIYESYGEVSYKNEIKEILMDSCFGNTLIESKIEKINNQKFLITAKQSNTFGLKYVYARPLYSVINSFPFTLPLILTATILFVFNLFTTYIIVVRNDKVYKKKLETLPIAIENTGNTFDKSIEEIQTKFNIINNSYHKAQPIIIQNRLRLLLLGRYPDITEDEFKKLFNKTHVAVAIIRFVKESYQNEILIESVEKLNNESIRCYRTSIQNQSIFIFNTSKDLIENQINNFENSIKEYNFKLYLSSVKELSKEAFSSLYEEAHISYSYRYLLPDEKIVRYENLSLESRLKEGNHNNQINEIESAILSKNITLAKKLFDLFITSLITDNYSLEYIQAMTIELVNVINRTIVKIGYDSFGIFGYDLREYYKKIKSLKEYKIWMEVCLENLEEYINESTSGEDSLKTKIDQIIQESMEKNLTLEYLADKLSIRTDELSKQFKVMYGINFSDYVRTLKINKAKQLLKDGYRVNEVASILGYSSSQYFIKIFKIETGYTPYSYSKKQD